jgi:two-component system chemotaxis response regulator CheB
MGRDGERGCELLRKRGATLFAQDAESSVVYGIPKTVAEAGLAGRLLVLGDMPEGS